jgi:hypothetical protein
MKLKVGDRVRYVGTEWYKCIGKCGTIRGIQSSYVAVEFDAPFDGHDGFGDILSNRGWNVEKDELELIPTKKVVFEL